MSNENVVVIDEKIINIFATLTRRDAAEISMDTTFDELGLKSIQVISLAALLEEQFAESPNFRVIMNMEKVSDVRDYIAKVQ